MPRKTSAKVAKKAATKPVLLSGGNPQIAKGYGDAPVQAYIAAMPGWKRDVGRHLDSLIVCTVPRPPRHVRSAVHRLHPARHRRTGEKIPRQKPRAGRGPLWAAARPAPGNRAAG